VTERTAYQCDHCGQFYATRHGCCSHERHCKKNPQRRPSSAMRWLSWRMLTRNY